mmetsp:Transcript_2902/g.7043  ORF Transcript_2902/g.7043 Transcript_2902/m.7043 type:complete len:227 (-) Transcript_2902:47-727(-)
MHPQLRNRNRFSARSQLMRSELVHKCVVVGFVRPLHFAPFLRLGAILLLPFTCVTAHGRCALLREGQLLAPLQETAMLLLLALQEPLVRQSSQRLPDGAVQKLLVWLQVVRNIASASVDALSTAGTITLQSLELILYEVCERLASNGLAARGCRALQVCPLQDLLECTLHAHGVGTSLLRLGLRVHERDGVGGRREGLEHAPVLVVERLLSDSLPLGPHGEDATKK